MDAVVADDAVFALEQQSIMGCYRDRLVHEYVRLKNIFEDLEFIDTFFLEKLSVDRSCLVFHKSIGEKNC